MGLVSESLAGELAAPSSGANYPTLIGDCCKYFESRNAVPLGIGTIGENMNLKDFVAESLVEIVSGLADAQSRVADMGAKVNPELSTLFTKSQIDGSNVAIGYAKSGGIVQVVDFDVAVTAIEGAETEGGIGVVAGLFALGTHGKSEESSQSVSRIKFKVTVSLPRQS